MGFISDFNTRKESQDEDYKNQRTMEWGMGKNSRVLP